MGNNSFNCLIYTLIYTLFSLKNKPADNLYSIT